MKDSDIILDALQFRRNMLMSDSFFQKQRMENYERKLAPTTIFGHNISAINKTTSEHYIEQINLADSEIKMLNHRAWEIDLIITSISKEALRYKRED